MSNSKYQPEIDGLRAIAVLSVILFHINELLLPGGFIGVDVFFVISGYLITSNIYPQLENKTFSFKDFYNRRIKRLLPSLYVVLFISAFLSTFLLLPDDLGTFNQSLKKIMIFWGNHYFAAGRDYFSPLSNELPLLHTWSLAIEEQFYFVWPIFIFLLIKINIKKKYILVLSTIGAVLSFALASALIIYKYPSWAYYSFPTRYGELLIGALLAIAKINKEENAKYYSLAGLILIFVSFFAINGTTHFPGITAIAPCLGTLLVLMSDRSFITNWLTLSPMVFIGKISYQLYLWHWPILAYIRYIKGQYFLSLSESLITITLTFLASVLSWKFIENPIRYSKVSFKKTFTLLYLLPTALLIIFIKISPSMAFKSQLFDKPELSTYGTEICHGSFEINCIKGKEVAPSILVTGDSHAAHLNYFIDELGKRHNWSAKVITSSSCSPVLEFDSAIISSQPDRDNCENLKKKFVEETANFNTIFFASRWDFQLGLSMGEVADKNYLSKLKKTFDWLNKEKKNVFVFSQIPMRTLSPQRAELVSRRLGLSPSNDVEQTVIAANKIVSQLVKQYPNFKWIDLYSPVSLFENGLFYQNEPVYKDKSHLNIFGAKSLAQKMDENGLLNYLNILKQGIN